MGRFGGEFQNKNHLSLPVLVQLTGEQRGRRRSKAEAAGWREPPGPRFCAAWLQGGSGVFGLSPALLGAGAGGGYIRRAVLAGASLAVLRGRGSLSVFVLLLLHLLHDFPDLALGSLRGARNEGLGGSTRGWAPPPLTATPELSPPQAVSAPHNSSVTLQLLTPG